jgi:hypothetical protein
MSMMMSVEVFCLQLSVFSPDALPWRVTVRT